MPRDIKLPVNIHLWFQNFYVGTFLDVLKAEIHNINVWLLAKALILMKMFMSLENRK